MRGRYNRGSRRRRSLVAAALAVLLTGCMVVRYQTSRTVAEVRTREVNYTFWGLVGSPTFDASELCAHGLARLESEMAPLDVVLASLTLGFWSPRTVSFYCAAEPPS